MLLALSLALLPQSTPAATPDAEALMPADLIGSMTLSSLDDLGLILDDLVARLAPDRAEDVDLDALLDDLGLEGLDPDWLDRSRPVHFGLSIFDEDEDPTWTWVVPLSDGAELPGDTFHLGEEADVLAQRRASWLGLGAVGEYTPGLEAQALLQGDVRDLVKMRLDTANLWDRYGEELSASLDEERQELQDDVADQDLAAIMGPVLGMIDVMEDGLFALRHIELVANVDGTVVGTELKVSLAPDTLVAGLKALPGPTVEDVLPLFSADGDDLMVNTLDAGGLAPWTRPWLEVLFDFWAISDPVLEGEGVPFGPFEDLGAAFESGRELAWPLLDLAELWLGPQAARLDMEMGTGPVGTAWLTHADPDALADALRRVLTSELMALLGLEVDEEEDGDGGLRLECWIDYEVLAALFQLPPEAAGFLQAELEPILGPELNLLVSPFRGGTLLEINEETRAGWAAAFEDPQPLRDARVRWAAEGIAGAAPFMLQRIDLAAYLASYLRYAPDPADPEVPPELLRFLDRSALPVVTYLAIEERALRWGLTLDAGDLDDLGELVEALDSL